MTDGILPKEHGRIQIEESVQIEESLVDPAQNPAPATWALKQMDGRMDGK